MQPNGGASLRGCSLLSEKFKSFPFSPSERCIYKVHNHLRDINTKAYEPEIIAIGPYHQLKKENLSMMEEHKFRYLQRLLEREDKNLEQFVVAIRPLEKEIRRCYAETVSLTPDQLVDMMVLDGCFIVQLVRKFNLEGLRDEDDPIFKTKWILNSLQRDLMLFENQVPFLVLRRLFEKIEPPNDERIFMGCGTQLREAGVKIIKKIQDWVRSRRKTDEDTTEERCDRTFIGCATELSDYELTIPQTHSNDKRETDEDIREKRCDRTFIRCATELREAGVKIIIKKREIKNKEAGVKKQVCHLFDISFGRGTLEIPSFTIEDRTDSFLRNLIAHEQYFKHDRVAPVADYVKLLDCLIDSSRDVSILSRYEVLDNWLGDGEAVSTMFNKLTDSVILDSKSFRYQRMCREVNAYCNRSWNRQMAKLRRNYLDSPWGAISISAATVLLLLTMTQTYFTAFSRQ